MPPNFQLEVNERLLTVSVTGELRAADVIEVVRAHYPPFHGSRILWDLTAADVRHLGADDFTRIAVAVRESTAPDVQRKTAYAVANQAAYLSVWKYLTEVTRVRVPVEYQAFTSVPAARQWLNEP